MTGVAARLAVVVVIAAAALPALLASAAPSRSTALYSGPGFDTCSAPTTATMQSWLASPYRAVGIYIGGVNRACPDGNLSPTWVSGVVATGWNLLPLYVGLQAPCVAQAGLALINPSTATADGSAAADDAVARAGVFGLAAGSPIYFDMEGYKTDSPSCTTAVQSFLAGWVSRLRAHGYLAGVYGSAASTIRDLIPSAGNPATGPDAVWIANWNGQTSVFGDPYVADSYWPSHQRIHQYRGGHKETYAGVTVNIDSNTVDGPVAGPGNVPAPAPPPPPQPQAGSVTTSDGFTTVSWPAGAFTGTPTVTATPTKLSAPVDGFAAGSYVVQLSVTNADGSAVTRFGAPVTVAFRTAAPIAVPALAADGKSWKPLPPTSYTRNADGSLTVSTTSPGSIGLLRDVAPPTTADGPHRPVRAQPPRARLAGAERQQRRPRGVRDHAEREATGRRVPDDTERLSPRVLPERAVGVPRQRQRRGRQRERRLGPGRRPPHPEAGVGTPGDPELGVPALRLAAGGPRRQAPGGAAQAARVVLAVGRLAPAPLPRRLVGPLVRSARPPGSGSRAGWAAGRAGRPSGRRTSSSGCRRS